MSLLLIEPNYIISIIGLILSFISIIVMIWIAVNVNNRVNREQAIKSFFVNELKEIQDEYSLFFNNVYLNRKSAVHIKNWLKIMSIRDKTFEESIKRYYDTKKKNIDLADLHFQLQIHITGTDDFNNSYKKENVIFSDIEREKILIYHSKVREKIIDLAITLNSLRRKSFFCRLFPNKVF